MNMTQLDCRTARLHSPSPAADSRREISRCRRMNPASLLFAFALALAPTLGRAVVSVEAVASKESDDEKGENQKIEAGTLLGGTDSPVQSKARPLGLSLVDTVKKAASDEASKVFQVETLPSVLKLLDQKLGERKSIKDTSSMALDPSRLRLTTDSEVRVYFVGEGAGYQNTLGFNLDAFGVKGGDPQLIFPNASSHASAYNGDGSGSRDASNPLLPGDFVNLGLIKGGSALDFFLIANAVEGWNHTYSTEASVNPDGLNHVVAFALADSPYLLLGFEDMYGGGDLDYNDVLIAVDIGKVNVARLVSTPEPALPLVLGSFLAAALLLDWRQRRAARQAAPVRVRT
jgi:hypothetical protein